MRRSVIAFLNNPSKSILLSPPLPSPWFIEHIAVEPVDLPSGISITYVTDESGRLSDEFLVFRNTSSIPLYVVGKAGEGNWEFDEISVTFPNGLGPVYKIIDGQAYIWTIKYNHPGTGYYFDWFKENQRDDSVWLYAKENQIRSETGSILDLEPRNQFDGDRPKDVKLPEPQKVALPIIYGSKEVQIPITVSYTLNTHYRSYLHNNFSDPSIVCYGIIFFVAIVAGVWLVFKRQEYWKNETNLKSKNA